MDLDIFTTCARSKYGGSPASAVIPVDVFSCFASVPIWQPWVHAFNGEYQIGDGDIGSIYKHVWVDTEMMADRGVRR